MSLVKMNTYIDLLVQELKELNSIQAQLIGQLPNVTMLSDNNDLNDIYSSFAKAKQAHKKRIEKSFYVLGMEVAKDNCYTINPLVGEIDKILDIRTQGAILNAEVIAVMRRVIHYEIARYGSAIHFADLLEEDDVRDILAQSLEEVEMMDSVLNKFVVKSQYRENDFCVSL